MNNAMKLAFPNFVLRPTEAMVVNFSKFKVDYSWLVTSEDDQMNLDTEIPLIYELHWNSHSVTVVVCKI